jgi:NADH:ubiquinone oxidoreductase subunit E
MKKLWVKPLLLVLIHGRPEERILANCKNSTGQTGPGAHDGRYDNDSFPCLGNCAVDVGS